MSCVVLFVTRNLSFDKKRHPAIPGYEADGAPDQNGNYRIQNLVVFLDFREHTEKGPNGSMFCRREAILGMSLPLAFIRKGVPDVLMMSPYKTSVWHHERRLRQTAHHAKRQANSSVRRRCFGKPRTASDEGMLVARQLRGRCTNCHYHHIQSVSQKARCLFEKWQLVLTDASGARSQSSSDHHTPKVGMSITISRPTHTDNFVTSDDLVIEFTELFPRRLSRPRMMWS